MKQSEIISLLEIEYGKIKHKNVLFLILCSLKSRNVNNNGKIFLSCTEFKKFGTTRKILYGIIRKLRKIGLLIEDGKEFVRFMSKNCKFRLEANKYLANTVLKNIFENIKFGIQNLYEKVAGFCNCNYVEMFKELGFKNARNRKDSFWIEKYVWVGKKNQIANLKTNKKYNIFTYLMKFWNLSYYETAKKLKL